MNKIDVEKKLCLLTMYGVYLTKVLLRLTESNNLCENFTSREKSVIFFKY